MQRRLRQVFTSLKEHTSVSYAKIATIGGFCDIDLILVKATSPDDLPLPERYIHEILKIFSISAPSYRAFSLAFARRFGRTKSWRVALKCLILLHRLLRALPNDRPLRSELLFARSSGLLSLYPCHFRDSSSFSSEDYTAFIRSYAHLVDEALDCLSLTCEEADADYDEEEAAEEEEDQKVSKNIPDKMKEFGEVLEILPQVQSLIDRAMDCQPKGAAARSFLIQSAMKCIIRDSFVCYTTFRKEIVLILDNLIQMPYRCSIAAFGVYKKAAVQTNQLCEFYEWCKYMGLCGLYEYPFVDRIPQIQIEALENFLNGMWQLTDSSSSTSSTMQSPSSSAEEDEGHDKQLVIFDKQRTLRQKATVRKLAGEDDIEPLIKLEDDPEENLSWEALLEASLSPSLVVSGNYFLLQPSSHCQEYIRNSGNVCVDPETNGWQMQLYNPYSMNPFNQQHSLI